MQEYLFEKNNSYMEHTINSRKQLGEKVKYAMTKIGMRKKFYKLLRLTDEQCELLKKGEMEDEQMYKKRLANAITELVRRKIFMKDIPSELPSKDKIKSMMRGENENIFEYWNFYFKLIRMPKRSRKKKENKKNANDWQPIPYFKVRKGQRKSCSETSFRNYCPAGATSRSEGTTSTKTVTRRSPGYGSQSQVTRKSWGSAYKPARG